MEHRALDLAGRVLDQVILPELGDLVHIPVGRVLGQQLEHGKVDRQRRGPQQRVIALRLETGDEVGDGGEVELRAPPVEMVERPEAMFLDRIDLLVAELRRVVAA